MTKIRGEDRSVKSLLGQKFHIDYYQRDYKWESKQIRELIEDLTSRFLLDYQPDHERKAVAHYGQYFLGSVIISNKDGDRFIVDGQQRLTSLTLLLIYLDSLQKDQPADQRVEIANLVYSTQYGTKSFNLDVQERNGCLQALINGDSPDPTDEPPSVQNLINRYHDITDIFPEELRGDALPYFLDWLTENVMLVEITAFSDDDAYTIFETMNDRGLSLTPTDMLKGYLLANVTDDEGRAQAGDAWKTQMGKLRDLGKDEDADCIKAWLRSQYADKIRERKAGAKPEDFDKLGTEFHRWVRENRDRIGLATSADFTSFVTNDFRFYARAYSRARRAADLFTEGLTSVFFNAQNSFTLQYPLMLAPLRKDDDDETVTRKMRLVATYVEIMLARRMWNFKAIDHSTMQYRAFLIMKAIRGLDLEELRADLIHRLSPEGADRDEYIDFETQEAFRLHGTNGPQVHRLLARLTEFAEVQSGGEARYPEYAKRSAKKGGYQIEHIWADHPERFEDEFAHPADFAAYRNRIGGLVLLPGPDNASYSDMTYEDKVDHYAKQNLLAQSLHSIAYENKPGFRKFREATGLPFAAKEEFKKADLDNRQALYTALANHCWSPEQLQEV
ncbi:DUF262 domain-containing HNH endonuclease family protein [Alisedimentitalea sp. MJ-SS2]|uniref:DUF262 domain-containing protein n=1 Tax=Aliisedimentitalea sp. MJ-SS2 TaxID=3049795 RepID=UPI00290B4ECD|nr:DUF262 domain-containing HNH endonuclease family protein [Alisedimentitalea sp. MJ-SS2]MDU8928313.1 DUF262 domain-containing HNH endonuclease family protein [Alisedimentitalea sp. MJ-SS2]